MYVRARRVWTATHRPGEVSLLRTGYDYQSTFQKNLNLRFYESLGRYMKSLLNNILMPKCRLFGRTSRVGICRATQVFQSTLDQI